MHTCLTNNFYSISICSSVEKHKNILSLIIKTKPHILFLRPAPVTNHNFCETRKPCSQPRKSACSFTLKGEDVEVCQQQPKFQVFIKGNELKLCGKPMTEPSLRWPLLLTRLFLHHLSPHCCQPRKILPLSWDPLRILLQLVKCFLT